MASSASLSEPASSERRLLLCCARVELPAAMAGEIRRLIAEPLDWDLLFRDADENGLIPLLARHLVESAPQMRASAQENLKTAARESAGHALVLTAELLKLLTLFESESILAIPFKGPVLAAQAYGDLALRQFEDIDMVIRQRDANKAHGLMRALGYQLRPVGAPSPEDGSVIPGEYSYQDDARQLIVELHTERTLRHFPVAPNLDEIAPRLVPVQLSGREVRTFAPEEGLTFLCVHGAKDFWARLSWGVDIAELVRANPRLDWDRAWRFAESLRAGRMLLLGLALANSLVDAPLSPEIAARLAKDETARSLAARFARDFLEAGKGAGEWHMDASERFRFRRRLVPGAVRGWQYAARLALAPAQDDVAAARLPAPLAPLYAVLRPLRLLRKYGQD